MKEKRLEIDVHDVFPGVKHRKCMRYLWQNMKKNYQGSLFSQNMWATAKTFKPDKYDYHMGKIQEKSLDALDWLDENHKQILRGVQGRQHQQQSLWKFL
jgi:hypothetical protein